MPEEDDRPGEVVIQTYDPEHYAIEAAAAQDYEAFYEKEIRYRESDGISTGGEPDGSTCSM